MPNKETRETLYLEAKRRAEVLRSLGLSRQRGCQTPWACACSTGFDFLEKGEREELHRLELLLVKLSPTTEELRETVKLRRLKRLKEKE